MTQAKDVAEHNIDVAKVTDNKAYWDNKADKDLSNVSSVNFLQKANQAGVGSVVVENTELVNLSINSDKLKAQNSFGSITPYSPNRIAFTGSVTNTLSSAATIVTLKATNLVQVGKTALTFKNIDLDPALELGFNFASTAPTTLPSGVVAGTSILGSSVADNVDGTRATLALKLTSNACKVITTSNARDWVECTFTPALNSTWTYQPYVFSHKTSSGDVWLVMQQTSGALAKLWYSSNGVDYSLLYDNFPCGSVTNSCMAWYEPTLDMIVYSATTYQQAQPSVLHKRTNGTWAYHNMPNVSSYLAVVKCIGYNTELSRYEAVIQDTRNNGVGYVLEWDWLSMFNLLTTNTTWHNSSSLKICVFNGIHYASEPSYHTRHTSYIMNMFLVPATTAINCYGFFKCPNEYSASTAYNAINILTRDLYGGLTTVPIIKGGKTTKWLMTFTNSSVYMLPVVVAKIGKNYSIDNRCTSNFNVDILVQLPAPVDIDTIAIKTPASFGSDSMIHLIANGNGKINGYINASNSMIDWRPSSHTGLANRANAVECTGYKADATATDNLFGKDIWVAG